MPGVSMTISADWPPPITPVSNAPDVAVWEAPSRLLNLIVWPADTWIGPPKEKPEMLTAATGDVAGLVELLAPDVVWTADSAGKVSAARRPVHGADRVARLIIGLFRLGGPQGRVEFATYNNAPALNLYTGDTFEGVITVEFDEGRISHFYAMRNPDKLTTAAIPRAIGR